MQQESAEIFNLFKKSEELVEMLRKGRAFTEELMCENERLGIGSCSWKRRS